MPDLAAILARSIERIFADIPDPSERRRHLEEFLRDELIALEHRVWGERSAYDES